MSTPGKSGRWIKGLLAVGFGLLLMTVLVVGGLWGLLQKGFGQKKAASILSALLSSEQMIFRLESLSGRIPWRIQVGRFSAADRNGVWLSGRGLTVEPDLRALLGGKLHLYLVRVEVLTFFRSPQSGETRTDSASWPDNIIPPVFKVDALTLDRLVLEAPFTPAVKAFTVQGRYDALGADALVDLEIKALDRTGDRLKIEGALIGQPAYLKLHAVYEESAGGILGRRLGPPAAGPIRCALTGEGWLSDWQGRLEADLENVATLSSSVALSDGQTARLKMEGRFQPKPAIWPARAAAHLGEDLHWALQLEVDDPKAFQTVRIKTLRLETSKMGLALQGAVDLKNQLLDMGFSLEVFQAPEIIRQAGITMADHRVVQGRITGPFFRPGFTLETDLGPMTYQTWAAQNVRISLEAALGEGLTGIVSQGEVHLTGLVLPGAGRLPEHIRLNYDLAAGRTGELKIRRLSIDGGSVRGDIEGQVKLTPLSLDTRLRLRIADLAEIEAMKTAGLGGGLDVDFRILGQPARALTVHFEGSARNLKGIPEKAAPLVSKDMRFKGQADIQGPRIHIPRLEVAAGSRVDLDGSLDWSASTLDLRYSLLLDGLASLAKAYRIKVPDRLKVLGRINGLFSDFNADAELELDRLVFANQLINQIKLSIKASNLPRTPQASIRMTARQAGNAAVFRAEAAKNKDVLKISRFESGLSGSRITGAVQWDTTRNLLDGQAHFSSEDLTPLGLLMGSSLAGSAEMDIRLTKVQGRQAVRTLSLIHI